MRSFLPTLLILALSGSLPSKAANAASPDLTIYQGSWQVTRKDMPGGSKPDTLTNQCATLGQFFTCAQSVNGKPGGLLVFLPAGGNGHYYTQTIMPEGRATGRDELQISGNVWTYSSRRDQGGKTTFYRTTNTYSNRNHIHYEQAHSTDGSQWTVDSSGDEVRTGSGH